LDEVKSSIFESDSEPVNKVDSEANENSLSHSFGEVCVDKGNVEGKTSNQKIIVTNDESGAVEAEGTATVVKLSNDQIVSRQPNDGDDDEFNVLNDG
jgi:hypothetical protein